MTPLGLSIGFEHRSLHSGVHFFCSTSFPLFAAVVCPLRPVEAVISFHPAAPDSLADLLVQTPPFFSIWSSSSTGSLSKSGKNRWMIFPPECG